MGSRRVEDGVGTVFSLKILRDMFSTFEEMRDMLDAMLNTPYPTSADDAPWPSASEVERVTGKATDLINELHEKWGTDL